MKITIPVLMIIFIIVSCSKEESTATREKEIDVKTIKVSDTIFRHKEFPLEFKISVSGCQTYSQLEVLPFETYTKFKVFVKDPSDEDNTINCLTGIFEENILENIKIKTIGSHQLVFNDSTLIKNIYIK